MDELERLIDLAKQGDVAAVGTLLESNRDLANRRLPSGESPLMAALYRGHHALVDAIVASGADLDVFAAAATGRLAELRRALAQPDAVSAYAYDGWTALHLAAFFGQTAAMRELLDAGAAIDAASRNGLRNTPLHAAAAGKHADAARLLLTRGANPDVPDAGGYTARRIAAENNLDSVLADMPAER